MSRQGKSIVESQQLPYPIERRPSWRWRAYGCCALVMATVCAAWAGGPFADGAPVVGARGAILIDRDSGQVLYAKDADVRMRMASTTKIMTALVALERGAGRLDEEVTVSEAAAATGGSSVFGAGDRASLRDVLRAALVRSSNEASVALGEHLAGSEEAFIALMNDKAREMGLRSTHFVDPHGLAKRGGGKEHYTTAREMATMAAVALRDYPLFREMVTEGRGKYAVVECVPRGKLVLENRNKLVGTKVPGVEGATFDGVKTGYTVAAGKCYVASATRGSRQLIAVVLASPDIFGEASALMRYGFLKYGEKTAAEPGRKVGEVAAKWGAMPVKAGPTRAVRVLVPVQGAAELAVEYRAEEGLVAPVAAGEKVGTITVRRAGQALYTLDAVAMEGVPRHWAVRFGTGAGFTAAGFFGLWLIGAWYGTRAKNTRRRRRMFTAEG